MTRRAARHRVHDVTVIDPATGRVAGGQDIWLQGDRIREIGPARGPLQGDDLDGRGLFAIPGLIDTHVHALGLLTDQEPGLLDVGWVKRQQLRNLRAFLHAGVTTIRDMGAPLYLIRRMARRAASGAIVSPRILFAGPLLTVPQGYPYFLPRTSRLLELLVGPLRVDLTGEAQARAQVDRLARAGVCCIKVMYQSGRYDERRTPLPLPSKDLLRAVMEQAHERGLKVAVHQVYRQDLLDLLDVPPDALEHLPIDEPLSEKEAERVAALGVPLCTTLMTYGLIEHVKDYEKLLADPGQRFEPGILAFLHRMVRALAGGGEVTPHISRSVIDKGSRHARISLERLQRAGATVVCGTDSGGAVTPPGCPHWELAHMVRAGLSPLQALRTATSAAATALDLPDLGRLAPGCIADLVLLGRDPLEEITAVAEVRVVIQGGRRVLPEPGGLR